MSSGIWFTTALAALGVFGISCGQVSLRTGGSIASLPHAGRHITLLHIADLHAQLEAHPELFWEGGTGRLEMTHPRDAVSVCVRLSVPNALAEVLRMQADGWISVEL